MTAPPPRGRLLPLLLVCAAACQGPRAGARPLSLGRPETDIELSGDVVAESVGEHRAALLACLAPLPAAAPAADVHLVYMVDEVGRVVRVLPFASPYGPAVDGCLADTLHRLRFTTPNDMGPLRVRQVLHVGAVAP